MIESLNLNTVIKQIEELFSSKVDKIIKLKKQYEMDISIDFLIIVENGETPAMNFDTEFIKFVAEIGARIDIDTYVN